MWPKECVTDRSGAGVGVTDGVSAEGFAPCETFWQRVAGVSDPHVVQFPPIGGNDAAT